MDAHLTVEPPERVLRAADADAGIVALYRAEARSLLGLMWMHTGDRAAAEDIVQEAFVRVHRAWHRIEDPERAAPYLRSVAFNLARSRWRRLTVASRHRADEPELFAPSAETAALADGDRATTAAALARLPRRQRECLVLRYFAGNTEAETAADLGISTNSVKTHLRRGLARLAHDLEALR